MEVKGWIGEQKTAIVLWLGLRRRKYQRFHNVILPSRNGTTQIDHLVVSPYGLFIIETKNRKGWIFGSEDQPTWTQTLYRKKYKFQNPLHQTYRQKKVLAEFLGIHTKLVHTIVYFNGDSELKTRMPRNVVNSGFGLIWHIKRYQKELLGMEYCKDVTHALEKHLNSQDDIMLSPCMTDTIQQPIALGAVRDWCYVQPISIGLMSRTSMDAPATQGAGIQGMRDCSF